MKTKIIILCLTTLAVLADIIVCLNNYRSITDEAEAYFSTMIKEQRSVAEKQVDSLFIHKHTDVFPLYSKCKSHYIKGDVKGLSGNLFEDFLDYAYTKPKLPDDVKCTYHAVLEDGYRASFEDVKSEIRMHNSNDDEIQTGIQGASMKGLWQTGWGLGVRENFGFGRVVEYIITPYAFSLRNNSYSNLGSYLTIDNILDSAYKFYTEDDQSDFKRSIVSNVERFVNEPSIDNSYYRLEENKKGHPFINTIDVYADYSTYMYNGLYYVFVKGYGAKIYELELNEEFIKYKKEQYITDKKNRVYYMGGGSIGLLAILWCVFAFWIYWEVNESKKSLLKRILSKCNPKKYVKNYNGHLLDVANSIYSKALATDKNDTEEILRLAALAESELGIELVSKSDIRSLRRKCNPKRFMKPYNPEKVSIANELYTKLRQEKLSCSEFLEIKSRVSMLCEGEKTHIRLPHLNFKMKGSDKIIILILICATIIYYARRCDGYDKGNNKEINSQKATSEDETIALADEGSKYLQNRLITGSTPYVDFYGKNYKCPNTQCSGIKVTAPKESDIIVIIKKDNMDGNVISHGYIRADESYQFDLPKGTYQTFFYYGSGWNPSKEMKTGIKGGFVKDEVFSKDNPQEINNAVLSYTLQLKKDGNFSTQSSNRSEMF